MSVTSWSRSIYHEEAPRAGGPQLLLTNCLGRLGSPGGYLVLAAQLPPVHALLRPLPRPVFAVVS